MLPIYVGLFIGGPFFLTMFISVSYAEVWLDVDYKQFQSCPSGDMVVGMCSSEGRKKCKTSSGGKAKTAHKIKCRTFDANVYERVSHAETTPTRVDFSRQPNAKVCDSQSFMGGFCVSGGKADCGTSEQKLWNQMECRRGYTAEEFEIRDICADIGQDIECPKDDDGGAWAAIGMCSGTSGNLCHKLNCYNRKPARKMYGLRCARLRRNGGWSPMDYKQFKSCPNNQVVVGMCNSPTSKKECRNGQTGQIISAHKIKCRSLDPNLYTYTTTLLPSVILNQRVHLTNKEEKQYSSGTRPIQECNMYHSVIGGFCVSGLRGQCEKGSDGIFKPHIRNKVECRPGYEQTMNNIIKTLDVCGKPGQDIECPDDDEAGVWATIGMCGGDDALPCRQLKCFASHRMNLFRTEQLITGWYGLRCVKIRRKAPLTLEKSGGESSLTKLVSWVLQPKTPLDSSSTESTSPSNTNSPGSEESDGNEVAGIASLSSGSGAAKATSDDEVALLIAELMKEKESSGTDRKDSCGLLFLMTAIMLLLFN